MKVHISVRWSTYASIVCLMFGMCMLIMTIYLAQDAAGMKWSNWATFVFSMLTIITGGFLSLSYFIWARRNWARIVLVVVLLGVAAFAIVGVTADALTDRAAGGILIDLFMLAIAGAFPIMIVVLLMNEPVAREFRPPAAAPQPTTITDAK